MVINTPFETVCRDTKYDISLNQRRPLVYLDGWVATH